VIQVEPAQHFVAGLAELQGEQVIRPRAAEIDGGDRLARDRRRFHEPDPE
jgi:hypothetical protein